MGKVRSVSPGKWLAAMIETCTVRALSEDDLPMVLAWRNHPEVRRFMLTQHEISPIEHRNWFEKATVDPHRSLLIVEEAEIPIGYVQFSNVTSGGIADWGFYKRPDSPKGTGRKLGVTALNHAFKELELHKVCGQAIESNCGSIEFHKWLGFIQEGTFRDQCKIGTEYHSLICFGLLAHEWQNKET